MATNKTEQDLFQTFLNFSVWYLEDLMRPPVPVIEDDTVVEGPRVVQINEKVFDSITKVVLKQDLSQLPQIPQGSLAGNKIKDLKSKVKSEGESE